MEEKGKDTLDSNTVKEENKDVQEKHAIGKSLDEKEKETREKDIKSKERISTFNAENSNLEGNNILNGDGTMNIGGEHTHYHGDNTLGLPAELKPINPNTVHFNVDSCSQQYTSLLLKERFVILNCAHDGITINLKHTIKQKHYFESFLKYEVAFDDYSASNNISHLIEHCYTRILKDKQKLLLFIYDSKIKEPPKLLGSLTKINNQGKNKLIDSLRDNIYIVYLTYYNNQNYLKNSFFDLQNVNAFNIYMENRSFPRERIQLIKNQQSNGLWGNTRELLADLDKYETDEDVEDIILSKEEEERINFKTIIKNKKQPIARYVLFVATFFPKITPDVFRNYINILIKGKTISIKKKQILLSDIWDKEADDILEECQLISYSDSSQRFISFTSTADALLCEQQLLKQTNFLDQQARILINSKQLFTKKILKKEYDQIFLLITKLSTSFKAYYGDELLKEWLITIENQRKKYDELQSETDTIRFYKEQIKNKIQELENIKYEEDKLAAFKSIAPINLKHQYDTLINELKIAKFLFYKEESYPTNADPSIIIEELENLKESLLEKLQHIENIKNNISHLVYWNIDSFSNLLSLLYNKYSTKDIIVNFFSSTFRRIYRNHIVINILSKFLVTHTEFNGFEYYKIALENDDKKSNRYAFQGFINLFLNHPEHFSLFIERTKQWLPKEETEYEEYTKLEKYTLATLYVYLSTQMNSDKSNDKLIDGKTQDTFFNNEHNFSDHIHFIIHSIYNKHLIRILNELFFTDFENKNIKEDEITAKRVELIEYWYQLLKSISINDGDHTDLSTYIENIQKQLDASEKKRLIQELKKIRFSYNDQLLNNKEASEKSKIKIKRSNLAEFIKLLKNNHGKDI